MVNQTTAGLSHYKSVIIQPVRNAASDAESATTISGRSKNASTAATIVPTTDVATFPVLLNISGIVIALSTA